MAKGTKNHNFQPLSRKAPDACKICYQMRQMHGPFWRRWLFLVFGI